jgi:hypothetical protein
MKVCGVWDVAAKGLNVRVDDVVYLERRLKLRDFTALEDWDRQLSMVLVPSGTYG